MDIPIPKEDLIKIMQAGLEAPSGCNKQTTSLKKERGLIHTIRVTDNLRFVEMVPLADAPAVSGCRI